MKASHCRTRLKRLTRNHAPCFSSTFRAVLPHSEPGQPQEIKHASWSVSMTMKPKQKVGVGFYEYAFHDENGPITSVYPKGIVTPNWYANSEAGRRIQFIAAVRTIVKIRRQNKARAAQA